MTIRRIEADLFQADLQITVQTKLIVAFRHFAKAPKMIFYYHNIKKQTSWDAEISDVISRKCNHLWKRMNTELQFITKH